VIANSQSFIQEVNVLISDFSDDTNTSFEDIFTEVTKITVAADTVLATILEGDSLDIPSENFNITTIKKSVKTESENVTIHVISKPVETTSSTFVGCSNINNGALTGQRPMPQKFSVANGNNVFSMNRVICMRALSNESTYVKNTIYDSSQITHRKRALAIGKSSLKTTLSDSAALSLGHNLNKNTTKSAKGRMR
jgi:hypothetical protein